MFLYIIIYILACFGCVLEVFEGAFALGAKGVGFRKGRDLPEKRASLRLLSRLADLIQLRPDIAARASRKRLASSEVKIEVLPLSQAASVPLRCLLFLLKA